MNKRQFLQQLKDFESAGMKLVQTLSARDEMVCNLCREREAELFTIEEFKKEIEKGFCRKCRCCLLPLRDGTSMVEEVWKRYPPIIAVLKTGILSEEELNQAKQGSYRIPDNDIVWGAFNKKLLDKMKTDDVLDMGKIYLQMAMHLNKEGKKYHHLLEQSIKCGLMFYKKYNLAHLPLQLLTAGCCEICYKSDKIQLTIDEALKMMPMHIKNCKKDVLGNGNGFCSCCFVPQ